jgi:protein-disulfide isomerase
VPDEPTTKNARRDEAREAARRKREQQERRDRLIRWGVPIGVTVVVLAIVAVVVIVIVNAAPAPATTAGPRNMASDGILFVGENDAAVPVKTPAVPASGTPTPTEQEDDGLAHIVEYIDFSCPACQAFDRAYSTYIADLVAAGEATLEVHPIAILDSRFQGTEYSTRVGNVGACVADRAPESFLDVKTALFANQPEEGTPGLSNDQLVVLVHAAGLQNDEVDACIADETFTGWVGVATDRATSNADLAKDDGRFSTPTVVVNGVVWQNSGDFQDFVESVLAG